MWQPLFANLAVTVLALLGWTALGDRLARFRPVPARLLFGIAMALGTLGSMALSCEVRPGIFYDMRGPLIALAGFFGGWPAALVTAGVALVYRITLGGMVLLGALGIAAAACIGLAWRRHCRRRQPRAADLVGLAAGVAFCNLAVIGLMPAESRAAMLPHAWIVMLLSFGGAFLLGSVLLQEGRRRELARANLLYRSMVDALPDCLNIKDAQGRFLAANPATAALMQAPCAQALLGKTDFDFYPAELAAEFLVDEKRILEKGVHEAIEQKGLMADNSRGWLATLKTPVRDEDGAVIGVVTHNRDITASKQMQERLERTQSYLDQALENMNDGLAMFSADGALLFCNARYRSFFPQTASLRVPGALLGDIVRASIECGEVVPPAGTDLDACVADRMGGLRRSSERVIEMKDGRALASRTTLIDNGAALVMVADVTERRSFEKHLEYQALHDPLTGLANRACFNRDFARLLGHARTHGEELVVMLLDLDRFKEVNDGHGHAVGDALLQEVSRRLEGVVRPGDLVARLGGDEFALLLQGGRTGLNDAALAARVMKALVAPMPAGGVPLSPSGTIGYTLASLDASDADGLLKNADRALYQAKARRRGSWKKWTPETAPAAARAG